jgi:hypothetical protein
MLYSTSSYYYRLYKDHTCIYATRMKRKEGRTIRKREDKDNNKNNEKRREIYGCRHSCHKKEQQYILSYRLMYIVRSSQVFENR